MAQFKYDWVWGWYEKCGPLNALQCLKVGEQGSSYIYARTLVEARALAESFFKPIQAMGYSVVVSNVVEVPAPTTPATSPTVPRTNPPAAAVPPPLLPLPVSLSTTNLLIGGALLYFFMKYRKK